MKLIPLPAFSDNYIWMLHDENEALVVDPGEAAPVLQALEAEGVTLTGILVTHHHADHTGGVDALRERTGAWVVGPARESIPTPFTPLQDGEHVDALGLRFQVLGRSRPYGGSHRVLLRRRERATPAFLRRHLVQRGLRPLV